MLIKRYNIANHLVEVKFGDDIVNEEALFNYKPFDVELDDSAPLFNCEFDRDTVLNIIGAEPITDFEADNMNMSVLGYADGYIIRIFSVDGVNVADMQISKSSDVVKVRLATEGVETMYAINNVLMLMFTYFTSTLNTILMHSSVVMYNGKGYMFLGKSGTGKSTQSRMWLENIADTELLNDDNPAVRVDGGVATVYGTPWSGKTPCYKNKSVPVGGIVRIRRADYNKIEKLRAIKAYASLIPSCSCLKWDRACELGVSRTVENVVSVVNGYDLECLPNGDAARCCCAGVAK